jgi:predicted ATP-dependent serine protease
MLRVKEAAQMGFNRLVLPESNCNPPDAIAGEQRFELVGVKSVSEALDELIAW